LITWGYALYYSYYGALPAAIIFTLAFEDFVGGGVAARSKARHM